jgi:hypothetical protein
MVTALTFGDGHPGVEVRELLSYLSGMRRLTAGPVAGHTADRDRRHTLRRWPPL